MKKFLKNYGFITTMLLGIVAGCIVGAFFPVVKDAVKLSTPAPLFWSRWALCSLT